MLEKAFITVLGGFVAGFGCIWVFNHVNPWASFLMVGVIVYAAIKHITKDKKQ